MNERAGDYGLEEGRCERCWKLVTRKPGGRWHDQFGRDRCRADPDDGECRVLKTWPYQEPSAEPRPEPPKPPVIARGNGSITHNGDSRPGKLEVTIWGWRKNGRQAGIVLGEDAVAGMLQRLNEYDLLPRTWKQRRKS